jgi:folate-binding protein YgfZ
MVMRSPVHGTHEAFGARFFESEGWELPVHFGDPLREYESVRGGIGALDLCHTGKLAVTGKDRVRYLNGMLSNDIRSLAPGTGCHAALLSRQGHVEADVHVYSFADDLRLECPQACTARLVETLRKFAVADDVIIEDRTGTLGILSLQGPQAREAMEKTVGASLELESPHSHQGFQRGPAEWTVARRDRTGIGGFDLWLPVEDAEIVWRRWLEVDRIQPVGYRSLDALRVEAGIPWYGTELTDRTLPMEVGLEDAISLNKGCYRGQEIVARVMHRGSLDRALGGVAIDGEQVPARGAEVQAQGVQVGRVTSAVSSPALGRPLALAILKKDFLAAGTSVQIPHGAGRLAGEAVRLPIRSGV